MRHFRWFSNRVKHSVGKKSTKKSHFLKIFHPLWWWQNVSCRNVFLLTMWYLLLTNPLGIYYPLNIEWSFTEHETLEKKGFQLLYCTMREKREKKPLKKAHQLQREKISRFSATHALHSGQKIKSTLDAWYLIHRKSLILDCERSELTLHFERSNSVTRQVSFYRTLLLKNAKNQIRHFK